MVRRCATTAFIAVASWHPASAFVEPTHTVRGPALPPRSYVGADHSTSGTGTISSNEEAVVGTDTARSLCVGILLGLVVSLGAWVSPAAAEDAALQVAPAADAGDAALPPLPKKCIRTEGCIGDIMERWAKAKKEQMGQLDPVPSKYTIPSTGAGRYKLYGMDFASPISTIPDTTDGTYPLRQTRGNVGTGINGSKGNIINWELQQAEVRNQVEPLLGRSKYTHTYSKYAPFQWKENSPWELEGTKVNTVEKK